MARIHVQHGPKPKTGYTQVTNETLRGQGPGELGDRAFRLWCYFYSLPAEDWSVDRKQLDVIFPGPKRNEAALRELKATGYLGMEKRQVRPGGIWEWDWIFTADPCASPIGSIGEGSVAEAETPPPSPPNGEMGATSGNDPSPQVNRSPSLGVTGATSGNTPNMQVIPSPYSGEISTEHGTNTDVNIDLSAIAAPQPHSAIAAATRGVAGESETIEAEDDDTRTWRQMMDDGDEKAIIARIETEVDGFGIGEETMSISMLWSERHPKMIINTIMKGRGMPNSPVTARVMQFAEMAHGLLAEHGRYWNHPERLEVGIRQRIEEGWDDDRLTKAVQVTVDRAVREAAGAVAA